MLVELEITQFADQIRIKLFSKLINESSRALQKLLKYSSGAAISKSLLPAIMVLFVNFDIDLNDSESEILSFSSSVQYFHKLFSNN